MSLERNAGEELRERIAHLDAPFALAPRAQRVADRFDWHRLRPGLSATLKHGRASLHPRASIPDAALPDLGRKGSFASGSGGTW